MSPEVIAAIVTGVLGLATGLLVGFKDEILMALRQSERDLTGLWTGTGGDIEVPPHLKYQHKLEYTIRFQLKQSGRRLSGEGTVESDRCLTQRFKGVLYDNDTIIGEYCNTDAASVDRGVVVMTVMGTGKDITGFFLGTRMRETGTAFARIELKKQ